MGMFDDLHEAIATQIVAAWPELDGPTHPVMRVTQVNRTPWRERVADGQLAPPWAIYQVEPATTVNWAASVRAFQTRVSIYYVAEYEQEGVDDIALYIEGKLEAIAERFWAQAGGPVFWHSLELGGDIFDSTAENPFNRVYTEGNIGFFGGLYAASIVFGQPVSPSVVIDNVCGGS